MTISFALQPTKISWSKTLQFTLGVWKHSNCSFRMKSRCKNTGATKFRSWGVNCPVAPTLVAGLVQTSSLDYVGDVWPVQDSINPHSSQNIITRCLTSARLYRRCLTSARLYRCLTSARLYGRCLTSERLYRRCLTSERLYRRCLTSERLY